MSEHEPGALPRVDLDDDVIAAGALPAPASELPRQHGAQVRFDPGAGGFRVITDGDGRCAPGVWAAGDVTGYQGPQAAARAGAAVGRRGSPPSSPDPPGAFDSRFQAKLAG